ncbi:MAG: NC domain protein [Synechococcus sp. MED-G71]|nr:MAG: NC domain protein [Synechococcus sp. MED-G71]
MAAGDHLEVPRRHGLFMHHGIDLGDGTVAHYLEGEEILRSSLEDFSQGETPRVIEHAEADPTGQTLRRAMSRIGEQRYNLLFNNCEHFALWCKTGQHRSRQVERALGSGALGALALGQMLPAALLAGIRLLLQRGINIEQGAAVAKRALQELSGLRERLQNRLEQELQQMEQWWQGAQQERPSLRLEAQNLADQLAAIDELERQLQKLLKQGTESE